MPNVKKKTIKQSRWVLAVQLVGIELIILLLYLLLRIFVLSLDYFSLASPIILQAKLYEFAVLIILSFVQMFLIITAVISWTNETFLIYRSTLTHKRGLLSVREDVYYLNTIQDLQVRQGFFSRILNFGSVKFFSPELGRQITIMNIPNPKEIGDLLAKVKSDTPPNQKDNTPLLK